MARKRIFATDGKVPIAELQLDIPIDSRQDASMILFLQLRYESRREQR